MPTPAIIIVVVLLVIFGFRILQRLSLPETLSYVDPSDPELLNAIADAQNSLPYFWDKRASAINPDDYFLKIRLEGPKDAESIWISNPSIEGDEVTGIVNQSPALFCPSAVFLNASPHVLDRNLLMRALTKRSGLVFDT